MKRKTFKRLFFALFLVSLTIFTISMVYAQSDNPLPKLVDLGAKGCLPCKLMKPILKELQIEYAGSLIIEVIDIHENPSLGRQYNVRLIPTQVFYDKSGKELYRHIGFMSKKDILKTFERFGITLKKTQQKR